MINLNKIDSNCFIEALGDISEDRTDNNMVYKCLVSLFKNKKNIKSGFHTHFSKLIGKVKLHKKACTDENLYIIDHCFSKIYLDTKGRCKDQITNSINNKLEVISENLNLFLKNNFNINIQKSVLPNLGDGYFDNDFEQLFSIFDNLLPPLKLFKEFIESKLPEDRINIMQNFPESLNYKCKSIDELLLITVLIGILSSSIVSQNSMATDDRYKLNSNLYKFFTLSIREFDNQPNLFQELSDKTLFITQLCTQFFMLNINLTRTQEFIDFDSTYNLQRDASFIFQRTYDIEQLSSIYGIHVIPFIMKIQELLSNYFKKTYSNQIIQHENLKNEFLDLLQKLNQGFWHFMYKKIGHPSAKEFYSKILLKELKELYLIQKASSRDLEIDTLFTKSVEKMGISFAEKIETDTKYLDFLVTLIDEIPSQHIEKRFLFDILSKRSSILAIAEEHGLLSNENIDSIHHIEINDVIDKYEENFDDELAEIQDGTSHSYNIYQMQNIKLISDINNPFDDRVLRWFDPQFDVQSLYLDQSMNNRQKNQALITHNFAWALTVSIELNHTYS